ncbi:hypothetical protein JTB14_014402 [Gonioctena quinquepunctata]|nr:hypothetical protein JTB14_014402 [Gonioctena quinquepunctata]
MDDNNLDIIHKQDIVEAIDRLDINKGPGSDSRPPIFLKNCSESLVEPLDIIFNKSLNTGVFPKKFKLAQIIPIHKSVDESDTANTGPYRY